MSSWSMPRDTPEDILIQISVCNRGPEPATLARPADSLVSQYLDVVAWHAKASLKQARAKRARGVIAALTRPTGRPVSVLRGRCPAAVHRERDQQRADLRHAQRQSLCQRRDQQLCGERKAGRRQPASTRERKLPRTIRSMWAPAKRPRSGCGSATWRPLPWAIRSRALLKSCRLASGGGRVLSSHHSGAGQ